MTSRNDDIRYILGQIRKLSVSEANKPQHQGSLYDQLRELRGIANREGLYDAADFLKMHIENIENVKEPRETEKLQQITNIDPYLDGIMKRKR